MSHIGFIAQPTPLVDFTDGGLLRFSVSQYTLRALCSCRPEGKKSSTVKGPLCCCFKVKICCFSVTLLGVIMVALMTVPFQELQPLGHESLQRGWRWVEGRDVIITFNYLHHCFK